MKKKFLLAIPALMALTSCGFAKIAAEPKVQEFLEDTLAHEEIFGEVEEQPVIRGARQLNPVSSSAPAVAIQTDTSNPGYISIRYVAAVSIEDGRLADTTAVWHRTMYNADGSVKKVETDRPCTKAYTAINDGGSTLTIQAFNQANSTDYSHFVVYSMLNIPITGDDDCRACLLSAYVTLDNSVNNEFDAESKLVVTSVDQNKQLAVDNNKTGYFLYGTIGGQPNTIADGTGAPDLRIARFERTLNENDSFFICHHYIDGNPDENIFEILDASCISVGNPYLYDAGADSHKIKVGYGRDYSFNINTNNKLCDIDAGYSLTYTDYSTGLSKEVALLYAGQDESSRHQFGVNISPADQSTLSFKLNGGAISPSGESGANISATSKVICAGEDLGVYLKEQNEGHTVWINYPTDNFGLYVNNVLSAAVNVKPNGWADRAVYELSLAAGDSVEIRWGHSTFVVSANISKASYYRIYFHSNCGTTITDQVSEYCLVGHIGGVDSWGGNAHPFVPNISASAGPDTEYRLIEPIEFSNGDKVKVRDNNGDGGWYPSDIGDYNIPSAGTYQVYFNKDGGVDGWHGGYFYVAAYNA